MAKRPRAILRCPNVDLAIPDIVIALHDLAGIAGIVGTLAHFGSHALRVRRGLYFWLGLGQRRNRLRVFVG